VKRREFIAGLAGAAAWPLAARAQQPALPVIGLLSAQSADDDYKNFTVPFLQGLKETGYVEGQNVAVEYRYAENQFDRLPALAVDLVRRRVAVIAAIGAPETLAAKAATTTTQSIITDLQAAARILGLQLVVANASTVRDLEPAFATLSQQHVGAVLVTNATFFGRRSEQLAALAAGRALPTIFTLREFVLAGGLMSYGTSLGHSYHQVGVYTGRILKGEKPADLPVQQNTKIDLVINLKTAKALGLTIPETLSATADEVIQ
jgi:putative tryptophan/tyrosine transport system substrate-binding protein